MHCLDNWKQANAATRSLAHGMLAVCLLCYHANNVVVLACSPRILTYLTGIVSGAPAFGGGSAVPGIWQNRYLGQARGQVHDGTDQASC